MLTSMCVCLCAEAFLLHCAHPGATYCQTVAFELQDRAPPTLFCQFSIARTDYGVAGYAEPEECENLMGLILTEGFRTNAEVLAGVGRLAVLVPEYAFLARCGTVGSPSPGLCIFGDAPRYSAYFARERLGSHSGSVVK